MLYFISVISNTTVLPNTDKNIAFSRGLHTISLATTQTLTSTRSAPNRRMVTEISSSLVSQQYFMTSVSRITRSPQKLKSFPPRIGKETSSAVPSILSTTDETNNPKESSTRYFFTSNTINMKEYSTRHSFTVIKSILPSYTIKSWEDTLRTINTVSTQGSTVKKVTPSPIVESETSRTKTNVKTTSLLTILPVQAFHTLNDQASVAATIIPQSSSTSKAMKSLLISTSDMDQTKALHQSGSKIIDKELYNSRTSTLFEETRRTATFNPLTTPRTKFLFNTRSKSTIVTTKNKLQISNSSFQNRVKTVIFTSATRNSGEASISQMQTSKPKTGSSLNMLQQFTTHQTVTHIVEKDVYRTGATTTFKEPTPTNPVLTSNTDKHSTTPTPYLHKTTQTNSVFSSSSSKRAIISSKSNYMTWTNRKTEFTSGKYKTKSKPFAQIINSSTNSSTVQYSVLKTTDYLKATSVSPTRPQKISTMQVVGSTLQIVSKVPTKTPFQGTSSYKSKRPTVRKHDEVTTSRARRITEHHITEDFRIEAGVKPTEGASMTDFHSEDGFSSQRTTSETLIVTETPKPTTEVIFPLLSRKTGIYVFYTSI